ncbi:fas-binding factor 1 [Aegotheles albertisi]
MVSGERWRGWNSHTRRFGTSATQPKSSLQGSLDDVLGDLLGYDDETPVRSSQPARSSGGRAQGTSLQGSKRSCLPDDFFSKLPAEDIEAAEGSSGSDADPQALLQTLKEMDDMEADLLGIPKPSSGPGKTTVKGPGKCSSLGGAEKTTGKLLAPRRGESVPAMEKKLLSSPPAPRQHKKFSFADLDDPLAGLLSDEEKDAPKKPAPTGAKSGSEKKPEQSPEREPPPPQTPLHTAAAGQRREELTFEDDGGDLMDALGFGDGPKGDEKKGKAAEKEELQPARSKLDELLGRGFVAKILEPPGLGERREFRLDKKYQKQPEKEEGWNEEDFVFGAYQPTVASRPEARLSRRQSVSRFSAENSSKPEPHSKPPPSASQSPVHGSRAGGSWLGLKDEGCVDSELPSPAKATPSPAAARRPGPTSQLLAAEEAATEPSALEEEEENWLSAALSRRKAQAQAKAQERSAKPSEGPGEGPGPRSPVSPPAAAAGAPEQDQAVSADGSRQSVPWLSTARRAPAPLPMAARGDPSGDTSAPVPTALFPGEQETRGPAPLAQVPTLRAHLQAAPQLQAESAALGLLHERRPGAAQPCEGASGCQAALTSAQARVAELESQVQTLELERTQQKLLLESLQQRHQEDLDLLESTHRSQVKVVEETYRQREERLQREKERLLAQLLLQSQDAEQARAELVAQHQQRVAVLEQQNVLEMERLRELQRASVQEMRKDYEEQLQRQKRLREQEISAVTSATSHTRSLNSVIEQIEKCSSDLHNLSQKMEAMHHSTSQELAMEAQQRDRQLKEVHNTLLQQQRDMKEERSRFQEAVAKMEARLGEQTRLLEQERWRATAEQSRLESLQHSLEEQRRVMTQQLSMERAELERAKSTLLEEQKSVMQKCSEERRKLAAEWAEFHSQQQLSKERMERDMDRARQMDAQREGTIVSLAKEQAELKIRGHELKAKEEQLVRDRELLEEAWRELRREKEVNRAMLSIQQQKEEMKSMSKLLSQEGARALREAGGMEPEHQPWLQAVQQHLEQRKQQEQHLHQGPRQGWLSTAHQRSPLEQLHQELPHSPVTLLPAGQALGALGKVSPALCSLTAVAPHARASAPGFLPPAGVLPWHSPGQGRESLAMAGPAELYAQLLLLRHRAQQDHDFLEEEQLFLQTLKQAPNAPSLSD